MAATAAAFGGAVAAGQVTLKPGPVTVTQKPGQTVSITTPGAGTFTLDVQAFQGQPKLVVNNTGSGWTIHLSQAKYAGTEIALDLQMLVPNQNGANLEVTAEFGGVHFKSASPIGTWLQGRTDPAIQLNAREFGLIASKLGQNVTARSSGAGLLQFRITGFALVLPLEIGVHGQNWPLKQLLISAHVRRNTTLVEGQDMAITSLIGLKSQAWPGSVLLESRSGWQVKGPVDAFSEILIEKHEGPAWATELIGAGTLQVEMPTHSSFTATGPSLKMIGDGTEDVHFSARLAGKEQWVHQQGASVQIVPAANEVFTLHMNERGEVVGEPALEGRGVGVTTPGSVVTIPKDATGKVRVEPEPKPRVIEPGVQKKPPIIVTGRPVKPEPGKLSPTNILTSTEVTHLQINRRNDLLNLRLELCNFRLVTGTNEPPYLTYEISERPSYLVFEFPPQAVAEEATTSSFPSYTLASGPTRLVWYVPRNQMPIKFDLDADQGLLDWRNWSLNVDPTAFNFQAGLFKVMAGWTPVIYFEPGIHGAIENQAELLAAKDPSFLNKLIAGIFTGQRQAQRIKEPFIWKPKYIGVAKPIIRAIPPETDPTTVVPAVPQGRSGLQSPWITNIELPALLQLSPDQTAKFFHLRTPDGKAEKGINGTRNALWHTRLGATASFAKGSEVVEPTDDGAWYYRYDSKGRLGPIHAPQALHATVRAIDSVDYDKAVEKGDSFSLSRNQRKELVDTMTQRSEQPTQDAPPFIADRVMLTSIGGYLKGAWEWPTSRGINPHNVLAWKHWTTLGRDQYVFVKEAGFLWPTGHRVDKITLTERHFIVPSGGTGPVAMLVKKEFLVLTKALVSLSDKESRALGFKTVTCETKVTPPLNFSGGLLKDAATGADFQFAMRGVDMDGQITSWHQSGIFVLWSDGLKSGSSGTSFNTVDIKLGGHPVAFVPLTQPGHASIYPCDSFTMGVQAAPSDEGAQIPAFRPALYGAQIHLHAVDQFMPSGSEVGAVKVEFDQGYINQGFTDAIETFMLLPNDIPVAFSDGTKFGGLVQPNSKLKYICRQHGPVPQNAAGMISKGQFTSFVSEPMASIAPDSPLDNIGKLMGVVSIWDLLPDQIDLVKNGGAQAPKIKVCKVRSDDKWGQVGSGSNSADVIGAVAAFTWQPQLQDWAPDGWSYPEKVFTSYTGVGDNKNPDGTKHAELNISALLYQIQDPPAGSTLPAGSSYKLDAGIYNFIISAAGQIDIKVQQIAFHSKTGGKPEVNIDIEDIQFKDRLAFVGTLESLISTKPSGYHYSSDLIGREMVASNRPVADGFAITPIIDIDGSGLTAGISVTVPTISVGVVAIMNISVLAEMILPWFGDALTFQFDFCTKDAPFRVCVYGIAGGGFLGIALTPSGLQTVEGSIEFGACVAVNFGVASGSISLMAGFYFKYTVGASTDLTGYVRFVGEVDVLGIISASITLYLGLNYEEPVLSGDASVTVKISLFCFSKSVSVGVHKEFAGGGGGGADIGQLVASDDPALPVTSHDLTLYTKAVSSSQFQQYCGAFGA